MPLRILLRPSPLEYGRFREQYEALAEDLEGEGVLVRVLPAEVDEADTRERLREGGEDAGDDDAERATRARVDADEEDTS